MNWQPLRYSVGTIVGISGTDRRCIITQIVNGSKVGVRDVDSQKPPEEIEAAMLVPDPSATNSHAPVAEAKHEELTLVKEAAWKKARSRLEAIRAFVDRHGLASQKKASALQYGCHVTRLYTWLRRYRNSGGAMDSLLDRPRSTPKGTKLLDARVEAMLAEVIEENYLTPQRQKVIRIYEILKMKCHQEGIPPEIIPHENTVRRRINAYSGQQCDRARLGPGETSKYRASGEGFTARFPLEYVEVDHTKLDVMLIDPVKGYCLGRPWITVAIDVFSRMIVGYYVGFEPPGAFATGLCISQAILPKDEWLRQHASYFATKPEWPCHGLPVHLHTDNGKDFRGDVVKMACERYSINVVFRPLRKPEFGAHIERFVKTLVTEVHSLPGTTFSNPVARGKHYDSSAKATLSFRDFDRWLANFICCKYHYRVHSALGKTPLERWHQGWDQGSDLHPPLGSLPALYIGEAARRLTLDFLPFEKRQIWEGGVVIETIWYSHPLLRQWIRAKDPKDPKKRRKFLFRFDPRDLSYIYFLNPETERYEKISYKNPSHPQVTKWEVKNAREFLAEERSMPKNMQNEQMIFDAIQTMWRTVEAAATHKGKLKAAGRVRPGVHEPHAAKEPPATNAARLPTTRKNQKKAEASDVYDDLEVG